MADPATTYVLCHGAWGGSYGFKLVRPLLWQAGHEVHTPSLTGIGERSHLAHPMVDLSLHIRDLVNAIVYEDVRDIVLLGFSYGGMVVTGALNHIGDRVRHLVYLDAFVPDDGQSAIELFMPGTGPDPSWATPDGDPATHWLMPALPRELDTRELTAWSDARRVGQPLATLTEPVRLSKPVEDWPCSLTYIKATADPGESADSAFNRAAARARSSDRWAYHEIEATHMIPFSHPRELADILLALA